MGVFSTYLWLDLVPFYFSYTQDDTSLFVAVIVFTLIAIVCVGTIYMSYKGGMSTPLEPVQRMSNIISITIKPICFNCGCELGQNANYCIHCGRAVIMMREKCCVQSEH